MRHFPRNILALFLLLSIFAMGRADGTDGQVSVEPDQPEGAFTVYREFPFDAEEAKRRQRETAEALGVPVELEVELAEGVTMAFRLIPAGEFLMGAADEEEGTGDKEGDDSEKPRHRVRITRSFYMAKHECTQAQWKAVTGGNPSEFTGDDQLPVDSVSLSDIKAEFLAKLEDRAPEGMRFALPTEAQWEYACRAGTITPFHFGDTMTAEQANFDARRPYGDAAKGEHRRRPLPVGSFAPNAWGLYDMHGNVHEWCDESHARQAYRTRAENEITVDPVSGPGSKNNVYRGGSWHMGAAANRAASRFYGKASRRSYLFGFRAILTLE